MKKYVIVDLCVEAGRNFIMSLEKKREYSKALGYSLGHSSNASVMSDAIVFNSEEEARAEIFRRKLRNTAIIEFFKF